jgi:GTP-binding protein
LVGFNKFDLPEATSQWPQVRDALEKQGYEVFAISGLTQQGVRDLMWRAAQLLEEEPEPAPADRDVPVIRIEDDERIFWVEQLAGGWRVKGQRVERLAEMTPFQLQDAVYRFHRALDSMGVLDALREAGVQPGDTVHIGEMELEWSEEDEW